MNAQRSMLLLSLCALFVIGGTSFAQDEQPPVGEQPRVQPADEVEPVDPPPPAPVADLPPLSTNPFQDWLRGPRSVRERSRSRLASAPDMFGDSQVLGTVFDDRDQLLLSRFPITGGGAVKLAENGNAQVRNRLIFDARQFDAGLEFIDANGFHDRGTQRYTFGFEKVLDEAGSRSIGVRVPLAAGADVDLNDGTAFDFGGIQSVTVLFKQELIRERTWVFSAGSGLGIPVHNDTTFFDSGSSTAFRIRPEAVHVQPFLAFLTTPTDDLFFQGFLQFDFPTTGNPVEQSIRGTSIGRVGRLNPQPLMFVDLAGGVWLVRNSGGVIRGVAGVVEFHYTTTLTNTDAIVDRQTGLTLGNDANRVDLAHFTTGVQTNLADGTAVRFGVVLPANDGFNRVFDAEFVGSVIKPF